MKVLCMPVPASETTEAQDNQDGARKLLELITYKFLSQVDLSSW